MLRGRVLVYRSPIAHLFGGMLWNTTGPLFWKGGRNPRAFVCWCWIFMSPRTECGSVMEIAQGPCIKGGGGRYKGPCLEEGCG